MSRAINPYGLRMPLNVREALEAAAEKNRRSLNAEIVSRLEASLADPDYGSKEPPRVVSFSGGSESEQAPDEGLLQDVLEVVEEISEERKLRLPPAKKARLIKLIYDEIVESEEKEKSINKERVFNLIKLAS